MGWLRRYRWWAVGSAAVIVLAAAAVVVWWPRPKPAPGPLVYRDFDVCLLTGARGVAEPDAAAVWSGAQQVSQERRVRALYVPVVGDQTTARAETFLASLVAQDCDVIVAVGDAPVAAAVGDRSKYPGLKIVAVGLEIDGSSPDAIKMSTVDVLRNLVPVEG